MAIKPSLQAMWLVDDAEQSDDGKMHVSGLFDRITVRPGESYTAGAYLFFSLRGTHAPVKLTLTYTDLQDNDLLMEVELEAGESGPLHTQCVCHFLPEIPVPHGGCYVWDLVWEGESIGSSRLWAYVEEEEP